MTGNHDFDIVVIGGGSGLTAAYHAAQDEKSVAVVDARPDALGGTCLNRGCIPTKTLIQSAETMKTIREAHRFGIHLDQQSVSVDFPAIMQAMRDRRRQNADGVKEWVETAFTPFYGRARFVDDKLLEMEDGSRVTGDKMFVASGARPAAPPIPGLESVDYLTNEGVLELDAQPPSLLVLGGGYIGCEMAHFFATLGTEVTVVDRQDRLLHEDDDVRELFTRELAKKAHLELGVEVTNVTREENRYAVAVRRGEEKRTLRAAALLVATGREPNTDGLDLDNTGVALDAKGWIHVDEHLRTTHPDIYAYGDVIGRAMFKHTSSYEGELAYCNSQGDEQRVSSRANPHAVFSDPQIGAVGLTEQQCRERGLRYAVIKRDYGRFAKGKISGSPPGFAKLLVEEETDRILGFHMIGPSAADLVHEVVVAMSTEPGTADAVRRAIHIHPTLPELIQQVFEAARDR